MQGTVSYLEIAPEKGAPVQRVDAVRAVPGLGLEGDRYFTIASGSSGGEHADDDEVTLIETENIEEFNREYGTTYHPADMRRNIATRGIRLNDLAGREFRIGDVRFRGHGLCEPCKTLAKLTTPDVLQGLLHKAGLRAQILTEGTIRVGDVIEAVGGMHDA